MRIEVTLPWPPKLLSPNVRSHWAAKAKAAKAYRSECAWTVKGSQLAQALKMGHHAEPTFPDGPLHLWIDFYPPDRRSRDDDNMIASFKSGRDGIADALGVNDSRFVCHPFVKDEIGGMVKVRITSGPAVSGVVA